MEFLLIATTHFLALLSPGADFFLILQSSLRLPSRYGIALCGGIASANALYLLLALLGLEALKDLCWLVTALKYGGSLYLIFLGILLLKAPRPSLGDALSPNHLLSPHRGRQFLLGFMSGILNPKNMLFYLSLFTVMVSAQTGFIMKCYYALWMTSVVFLWDCLIVHMINKKYVKDWLGRGVYYIEKISGSILTLAGISMVFT